MSISDGAVWYGNDAVLYPSDQAFEAIAPVITLAAISPVENAIIQHLSAVPGVDAVYAEHELGEWCVFSVVEDHEDRHYDGIIEAECRIERRFPGENFSFRIRAHQGRETRSAVPVGCAPLFYR